jgi:hypothetical protein
LLSVFLFKIAGAPPLDNREGGNERCNLREEARKEKQIVHILRCNGRRRALKRRNKDAKRFNGEWN